MARAIFRDFIESACCGDIECLSVIYGAGQQICVHYHRGCWEEVEVVDHSRWTKHKEHSVAS